MVTDPLKVRCSGELLNHLVPAVSQTLSCPHGFRLVPEVQLPSGADPAVRRHEHGRDPSARRVPMISEFEGPLGGS
jgi:hypothetical protein